MNIQIFNDDLSEDVLEHYFAGEKIAVSVKTMGPVPGRDRLCLVQLCGSEAVSIVKINRDQYRTPRLEELLNSPILKVFHGARLDIAHLFSQLSIRATNGIFCTKIASKLARTYTSNHDLKSLIRELEGVELNNPTQNFDWGDVENFSDEQLSYVAKDVRYLCTIQEKLQVILEREERWELAQDSFDALVTMISLDLLQFGDIFS